MAPQRIAECAQLPSSASSSAANGSENARRGGNARAGPRVDRLVVLPVATSSRAHVVAITSDAKRVFLALDVKRRALKCVYVKPSEGLANAGSRRGGLGGGGAARQGAASEELVAAYGGFTLLVASRATADGALSQLLAVLPNPSGARRPRCFKTCCVPAV
jgi:hypothetical protein